MQDTGVATEGMENYLCGTQPEKLELKSPASEALIFTRFPVFNPHLKKSEMSKDNITFYYLDQPHCKIGLVCNPHHIQASICIHATPEPPLVDESGTT